MGRKGWKRGVELREREKRQKEMQVVASCEPLLLLHQQQQQQCSSYNPPATAPRRRAETMKKFKEECSSLVVRKLT